MDDVTVAHLFWQRVEQQGPENCWPWQAGCTARGYGALRLSSPDGRGRGPKVYAHRAAYELTYGPIPEGLHVLHRCDNPPCCNPAHLFSGTPSDNAVDREVKGRRRPTRGEDSANAKLTWPRVAAMRREYAAGGVSMRELAKRYGVAYSTARYALIGRTWRDV